MKWEEIKKSLAKVPTWAWAAGGAVIVVVVWLFRRGSGQGTIGVYQPEQPAASSGSGSAGGSTPAGSDDSTLKLLKQLIDSQNNLAAWTQRLATNAGSLTTNAGTMTTGGPVPDTKAAKLSGVTVESIRSMIQTEIASDPVAIDAMSSGDPRRQTAATAIAGVSVAGKLVDQGQKAAGSATLEAVADALGFDTSNPVQRAQLQENILARSEKRDPRRVTGVDTSGAASYGQWEGSHTDTGSVEPTPVPKPAAIKAGLHMI